MQRSLQTRRRTLTVRNAMATKENSDTAVIQGRVEDVQELRRSHPTVIPTRYVRDGNEMPSPALSPILPSVDVPVIDLSRLGSCSSKTPERESEMAKLAAACEGWGFFQVRSALLHISSGSPEAEAALRR